MCIVTSDHAKCHVRERTEEYMSQDSIIRLLQEVFSKVTESILLDTGRSKKHCHNPAFSSPFTLEGRAVGNPAKLAKTHVGRLS